MSTILEQLRAFNMNKQNSRMEFSNYGALSDISKKYNAITKEKERAAANKAASASGGSTSLLEALRKKNMDATTSKM